MREGKTVACHYNNSDLMIGLSQQGLKDSIRDISVKRREWDDLFSDLQGLLKSRISKLPVARVRVEFQQRLQTLKEVVKTQTEELERIRYRAERLKSEGTASSNTGHEL